MREQVFYTYIVASWTRVLYIGITNDIERRMTQHREAAYDGFTKEHRCRYLVWFERYAYASSAIAREKQLKGWRREKKIALIEQQNSMWKDLSADWGKSFLKP